MILPTLAAGLLYCQWCLLLALGAVLHWDGAVGLLLTVQDSPLMQFKFELSPKTNHSLQLDACCRPRT